MRLQRKLTFLALALVSLANGGCVAVLAGGAAGAAGYAYAKAGREREYAIPPEQVARASHQALLDLDIVPSEFKADVTGGVVRAKTATGKKIAIHVKRKDMGSEVSLRVGAFGDEALTDVIYQRINDRLGVTSAPVMPAAHWATKPEIHAAPATSAGDQPASESPRN